MKSYSVTIQMKSLKNYFHMVLLILFTSSMYILTFESVSEILWCDDSNETSLAELCINYTVNFLGFYKYEKVISFVIVFFTK